MNPELQMGGGEETPTVQNNENNATLKSAVDIAMEGGVRPQEVQYMAAGEVSLGNQTEVPIPTTTQEQGLMQQGQPEEAVETTDNSPIAQSEVGSQTEGFEGLTPEEATVATKAEQLKPGWGETAKNEINKLANRVGVFKVLGGVGNLVEGMRAKRVYTLALKETKANIKFASENLARDMQEKDWFKRRNEDELTEDANYLAGLRAGEKYLSEIKSGDLQRGGDRYTTPYRQDRVKGESDASFTINSVQDRWRLRGENLGSGDNILNLLESVSRSIEETVDNHREDMVGLNRAKSEVEGLRAEVSV